MPILHYKLKSNDENVNLNNEIHAQSFILRRIMIQQIPITGGNTVNNGGLCCSPSHMSGLELVSGDNSNSNDILIAYDENIGSHSIFYDQEFDSETVPRSFNVKTFKFDKSSLAEFVPEGADPSTHPGKIISVDLFFQFASLYNYEQY